MAVYNEILVGRFNRALQKLFSMKGPPPAPQLASEIMVGHNIATGVENRYLEGWNLFMSTSNLSAPGAGNRSGFAIRNPSTSGVVTVIEQVLYANVVATVDGPFGTFQSTSSDLNVLSGAPRSLDKRVIGSSAMQMSQQNNATVDSATIFNFQLLGNTSFSVILTDDQEITLLPGDRLAVYCGVLNQGCQITYKWRERPLEDSEKS